MRKKYFADQAKTLISTPTALLKPTRPTTPDKIENRFILLYSLNPQIILILHRLLQYEYYLKIQRIQKNESILYLIRMKLATLLDDLVPSGQKHIFQTFGFEH